MKFKTATTSTKSSSFDDNLQLGVHIGSELAGFMTLSNQIHEDDLQGFAEALNEQFINMELEEKSNSRGKTTIHIKGQQGLLGWWHLPPEIQEIDVEQVSFHLRGKRIDLSKPLQATYPSEL